jgi:hypothetical protein
MSARRLLVLSRSGYFRETIERSKIERSTKAKAAVTVVTCSSSRGRAGSIRTSGPAAKLVKNASGAPNIVTESSDVAPARIFAFMLVFIFEIFSCSEGIGRLANANYELGFVTMLELFPSDFVTILVTRGMLTKIQKILFFTTEPTPRPRE